ncbi:unnamed protein product [Schistocephalus solidus]|uniref:Ig-like domain-containing protein n=1 Tax=Schistocephalus solidus TaxID=70667 RepID=A0A183STF0_SCHSO|nr:unnamed protein product [Schistocephalus solidus]
MKKEPARILEGPQDTKTICGEDIVLFCKATGNPDPQVAFQRNGIELDESSEAQGLVVRSVGQNALTLRMKVQMTNDGDVFTCQVHNHFGMDSAKATITVYDANEPPPKGLPKILENPTTTMGQIGDATHLQCDVSATPPASIVWIKDNFYPLDLNQPRLRIIGNFE